MRITSGIPSYTKYGLSTQNVNSLQTDYVVHIQRSVSYYHALAFMASFQPSDRQ